MFVSQQKITARFGFSIDAMLLWVVLKSIFNNYSPKAKLILLNNPGDYSTILTEPEVNNCFSIFTRSDLNRIRKETIKKRLV